MLSCEDAIALLLYFMERFTFVTHSQQKLADAERFLGMKLLHYNLDLPEIQSVDVEEVAAHKVKTAHEALKRPVLVEDTGLYLDAWSGLPGALVKWFVQRVGDKGICEMLGQAENRHAWVKTVIATYDTRLHLFSGTLEGEIARQPRGANVYGFNTLFIPYGSQKTLAEMTPDERQQFSMRRLAFQELIQYYGPSEGFADRNGALGVPKWTVAHQDVDRRYF